MLYAGGFPRSDLDEARRANQRAIFQVQLSLEESLAAIYPGRILLCDRGNIDGAVYWPDGVGE